MIITHNGAERLPHALAHLAAQELPAQQRWEIIIVDNGSTDNSAQVARELWNGNADVPLVAVTEPRLGTGVARWRGIEESNHEIVLFVDDDNWLNRDYIAKMSDIMTRKSEIGACGGFGEAVSDAELPDWFDLFKKDYAVGAQISGRELAGFCDYLWGAGMAVRRSAIQALKEAGFTPFIAGRQADDLIGGEDAELSYALRISGWRLWFDPNLRYKHFLPAYRLEWQYLRQRYRALGKESVLLDPYLFSINDQECGFKQYMSWQAQAQVTMKRLVDYDVKEPYRDRELSRLFELLRRRDSYDSEVRRILEAPWRPR